ncbi:hypothetical protein [Intestinibacter sp.]|uniref:hypothetical protein n=1 Tax=Intestinibacter sp. TaxID=1965304 RepID=UPI003F13E180
MNLSVIPIQSFSDIITNSSSELFVLNTDNTVQKVEEILNKITSGYCTPIIFNLERYNKWKEDKSSVSDLEYSYFDTASGWLVDLDDEDSLFDYRLNALINIMEYHSLETRYFKENDILFYIEFMKFAETIHLTSINRFFIYRENKEKECKEFLKQFENSSNMLPSWWMPGEKETVQGLNGKILVLSCDDNSMPFESFDFINEVLNGYNIHLG